METYCCNPKFCNKKKTCNHHIVEPLFDDDARIDEDLSDICLPDYRLYIEGNCHSYFDCKESYKELFDFYDNECNGSECGKREFYDKNIKYQSSRIECKLGEEYTCKHHKHPINVIINDFMATIKAEEEAFGEAGLTEGTVTYICPKCGGEAIVSRYMHSDRLHGIGSGCPNCGTSHT